MTLPLQGPRDGGRGAEEPVRPAPPPFQPVPPLRLGYLVDTLVTGGAERLVVTFAEAVSRRNDIALTVFVLNEARTPFRETLEALGTNLVTLPGRNIVDIARFARLVRALRHHRIEYLHAHLASSTTLGAFAARLLGLPFATTIHNVRPSVRRTSATRRRLHHAALRLPGVQTIAVGHAVAEAARAQTGRPVSAIIPNAIARTAIGAPGARTTIRRELGLADGTVVLVCVGAIIGQKAHDVLLDAFARVARQDRGAVLLLAGDPRQPDRQRELVAQARALGITQRVHFLGFRADISDLLAASDIFVSSSDWEGAPVSLLEAMANHLPCVVTDVGENRRVLRETGSILVPPQDPGALSAGLLAMIRDADRRAAAATAGYARVFPDYGVEAWVERLLDLYAATGPRHDWRAPERPDPKVA